MVGAGGRSPEGSAPAQLLVLGADEPEPERAADAEHEREHDEGDKHRNHEAAGEEGK